MTILKNVKMVKVSEEIDTDKWAYAEWVEFIKLHVHGDVILAIFNTTSDKKECLDKLKEKAVRSFESSKELFNI